MRGEAIVIYLEDDAFQLMQLRNLRECSDHSLQLHNQVTRAEEDDSSAGYGLVNTMASYEVLLVEGCSDREFGWIAREANAIEASSSVVLEVKNQALADILLRDWVTTAVEGDPIVIFHIGPGKINAFATVAALSKMSPSVRPQAALLWRTDSMLSENNLIDNVHRSHDTLQKRLEAAGFVWMLLDEMLTSHEKRR